MYSCGRPGESRSFGKSDPSGPPGAYKAFGPLQWKFKTGEHPVYHVLEGIQSSAGLGAGLVYFGAWDGYFYALDQLTGMLTWKYAADNSWVLTTPAIKDGIVYIGTSDTYFFLALDGATGKEKYRYPTRGYICSSPSIAGQTAYFGDFTGVF